MLKAEMKWRKERNEKKIRYKKCSIKYITIRLVLAGHKPDNPMQIKFDKISSVSFELFQENKQLT